MTDPVAGADQARHPALSHVPRPMGWYRDGAGSLVTGYLMSPHEVANVWEAALAALPAPVAGADPLEPARERRRLQSEAIREANKPFMAEHFPDHADRYLPAPVAGAGYVLVREGTGGVMEDGTTNTPPLDFDAPPVETPAPVAGADEAEQRCLTCGEVHVKQDGPTPKSAVSWADPVDGHVYRPESWEAVARRLAAILHDAREPGLWQDYRDRDESKDVLALPVVERGFDDLRWLIDHSTPMHSSACAAQDDDAPCFCGVSQRYEAILAALSDRVPSGDARERGLDVERLREAIWNAETDDNVPMHERPRAEQVAAEYDRLSDRVPGETP